MICKHHTLPPPPSLKLSEVGNCVNRSTFEYWTFCCFQLSVRGKGSNKICKKKKKKIQRGIPLQNKCSNFCTLNLFSLFSVLWSVECVDPGAFVTVLFLWRRAHLCSFSKSCATTLPSEALRLGGHRGCADSSATHGHLQALSSCSNSFLFRWFQSQTSGKSRWLTHCWSAHDCKKKRKRKKNMN